MSTWECKECEYADNAASSSACEACDAPRPEAAATGGDPSADSDDPYRNIVVGKVLSVDAVPNYDKLRAAVIDVGAGSPLTIVTNATNVAEGQHVVVAKVGATVGEVQVKKATVGGVASEGMLCDAPMLGWTGGGAGAAALVPPEAFSPGARPPDSRPRLK